MKYIQKRASRYEGGATKFNSNSSNTSTTTTINNYTTTTNFKDDI